MGGRGGREKRMMTMGGSRVWCVGVGDGRWECDAMICAESQTHDFQPAGEEGQSTTEKGLGVSRGRISA